LFAPRMTRNARRRIYLLIKISMDKKSKIFFIIFGLLIIGSVAFTYYKIMIKKDYIIEAQTDCDPYVEQCFLWECDPESDVEGEACTGDPENDSWYFQVARRNAANIPLCDPDKDENCDPWTCGDQEADCSTEFCTEDQLEAQYATACSDPVKYNEENPAEEESACAEDDAECLAVEEEGSACAEDEEECLAVEEEVVCEEGDIDCKEESGEVSSEE